MTILAAIAAGLAGLVVGFVLAAQYFGHYVWRCESWFVCLAQIIDEAERLGSDAANPGAAVPTWFLQELRRHYAHRPGVVRDHD